jgi:actin-like ATPase involved in cell morphogenesis
MIVLGHRSPLLPSAAWLGPDGEILLGEAALRRGQREPDGLVREFKRRLGDTAPFMVRGTPLSAAQLTTMLMVSILDQVISREGERPTRVAVTHPANWGPYRLDIFHEAVRAAGVADAILVSEPEAAAIYYASAGRVADGEIVVVYDLGGGTFDVAILQRAGDQFVLRGRPDGVELLGGIDFDEIVFNYVRRAIDGLDGGSDDAWKAAVRRLYDDCVDAKEALSADVFVDIPVMLPARHTEIRLPRREFEELIRPSLVLTIDAVRRALASAHLEPEDIARVLLVGGSSRIPLVAELISSKLQRSVAVDVHPKFAVALGAAMVAASGGTIDERVSIGTSIPEPVRISSGGLPVLEPTETRDDAMDDEPPVSTTVRRLRRRWVFVGAGVVAVLVAGAVLTLTKNGTDGASTPSTAITTTTTAVRGDAAVVELGSAPAGLAMGFGSIWAVTQDGQLIEVDTATHAIRRRIALAPSLDDVITGKSGMWVTGANAVYLVDPSSGSVTRTIEMPGQPDGIAVGRGAIWIALQGPTGGALYRIDESSAVPSLVATLPMGATEVAVDDRFIWVSSVGPFLYGVDASSGQYTEVDVDGATGGIVIGFGDLWATVPSTNEVLRLDPTNGRSLGSIATALAPGEVVLGDGVVWVSEEKSASVIAIDPGTNAIVRRSVGSGPDRMVWSAPNLWVDNAGGTSLSIVPV